MGNALERTLVAGEVVIVSRWWLKKKFWHDPRFQCDGSGFGSQPFTWGRKVFGTWLVDGEQNAFVDGHAIVRGLTLHYQARYGADFAGPMPPEFLSAIEDFYARLADEAA